MSQLTTLHHAGVLGITQRLEVPAGMTVLEIVEWAHRSIDGISVSIRAAAAAPIEWETLPREMWSRVRPKMADALMVVFRPKDGGNVFKTIISVAASVAVLVAAPYLAPLIGTVGTGLLSAGFLLGTSYLTNKLFPTAQEATGGVSASIAEESVKAFSQVDSDANVLAKGMALPKVAGFRRVSPPELANPRGYLNSGVQTLDRIFGLGGHHALTDVQVDDTPVEDYERITTEIKDGAEATSVATFIDKITSLVRVGETLNGFSVDDLALEDQEAPSNSEPRYVRFSTKFHKDMEEVTIRLQLDSFYKTSSSTAKVRVPLRIRFRIKGTSAWTNLPEVHLKARDLSTHLHEIRFRWDGDFGEFDTGGSFEYEFYQRVPEATYSLSSGATGDQWQAANHFVSDTGLNDVQNIAGRRHGLRVTLDPSVNPKGEYEWEISRGAAADASGFTASAYTLSGNIYSFFEGQNISAEWRVPVDQDIYPPRIAVVQATVVVDQLPCQRPGEAILALRSIGQSVRNVTVLAASFVYDWDGTGWNTPTTSKNPAVHYRQLLADYLERHGIDVGLIVNDEFVAWRQECIDQGYEVSAVFSGTSIGEALAACAEAGFARPAYSIGFGVDWFRDRSGERPAMMFTPRNSTITVDWPSPEAAMGIRVSYKNEDDGYQDAELQVAAPGYTNFRGYEVASNISMTKTSLVNRRADFDILQRQHQGHRTYTIDTAVEGFICKKGTLIVVATDLTDDAAQGARVRRVIDSTNLEIDQVIPAQSTTDFYEQENVFAQSNIFRTGEQTAMMITTPTGTEMRNVVAAEDQIIRLDEPLSSLDVEGAHLVLAPQSQFERRCIVTNVERRGEERAVLTAVDEAQEIYTALMEKYG